ncbi:MAG: tetraacyldisaccharide 4'-kinase [Paludibacteraceae bacterium]|nr:tetraacyldisaccharide 4'-kinase [Paludibacteraceae bacterium]
MRKVLLFILSVLYKFGVSVRNALYDFGIIKSEETILPTISVGNLAVGGTGKTPHSEFLIRELLNAGHHVAYLSRGYMRDTKGLVVADANSTAADIGDEAVQVKHKFPEMIVVVDVDRRRALQYLKDNTKTDVVVLDDAYQYRKIIPTINILLLDCNYSPFEEKMLPLGRMRESVNGMDRADVVIVTKCPKTLKPVEQMTMRTELSLLSSQKLYFTSLKYEKPVKVETGIEIDESDLKGTNVLLVTGIERPLYLKRHLQSLGAKVEHMRFSDHYYYETRDFENMIRCFENLEGENKMVITTEKDLARLSACDEMPDRLKSNLYCISIEPEFIGNKFDVEKELAVAMAE